MVHARIASRRLHALLKQFPIVTILGARQVGKSTLARSALDGFAYLDLERAADLDRLRADPLFVLSENRRLIIDEAQRFPEIFPVLRSFIDEHPRHRIVLLGSASPRLVHHLSEALTGRVGFLELAGISALEAPLESLWVRGSFPRLHWSRPRATPEEWYPSYLRTCLEQDIPQLGFRIAATRLRGLLTMLAHAQGSMSNLSELGASLGINYHSVARIIDIFEGVFLVRRLPPWFANVGKRLVKSPKLYVRDTGLLHSLLGMPFRRAELLKHPKVGASFETFCIEQIVLHAQLADPGAEAFFYRTHSGREVDLILRLRGALIPIEIKLGLGTPDVGGLEACMKELGIASGFVVTLAPEPTRVRRTITTCNLEHLLGALKIRPRLG